MLFDFFNLMILFLGFDFNYVVTGHLGLPAKRSDVLLAKQFITDMTTFVDQSFTLFNNLTAYYQVYGTNHWAVLHNWMGDMAFYCSENMRNKYAGIVAGVDVYAWTGCWTLRETYQLFYPASLL